MRENREKFLPKIGFRIVVVVVVLSLRFCDRKVITWHNVIYFIKLRKGTKRGVVVEGMMKKEYSGPKKKKG